MLMLKRIQTFLSNYRVFVLMIVLLLVIVFFYTKNEDIGRGADVLGIMSAFLAFIASALNFDNNRIEQKARNQPISIKLINEDSGNEDMYELPFKISRGDVSRSEVQGYLGLIPLHPDPDKPEIPKTRYDLSYVSSVDFFEQMRDITRGNRNELTIWCNDAEYKQFHFSALSPKTRTLTADTPEIAQN